MSAAKHIKINPGICPNIRSIMATSKTTDWQAISNGKQKLQFLIILVWKTSCSCLSKNSNASFLFRIWLIKLEKHGTSDSILLYCITCHFFVKLMEVLWYTRTFKSIRLNDSASHIEFCMLSICLHVCKLSILHYQLLLKGIVILTTHLKKSNFWWRGYNDFNFCWWTLSACTCYNLISCDRRVSRVWKKMACRLKYFFFYLYIRV